MAKRTIRELIEMTGVTESALRYYAEKGILIPTVKSPTGRREWLYDDEALGTLRLIMLYRQIGLSIEDIGMIIHQTDRRSPEILEKRLRQLRAEREKVDMQITTTEILVMIESISSEGCGEDRSKELLLAETVRRCSKKE